MRNIAASDYFRRMKEEHARKEVERQESRARQVQHDLVIAAEQVSSVFQSDIMCPGLHGLDLMNFDFCES